MIMICLPVSICGITAINMAAPNIFILGTCVITCISLQYLSFSLLTCDVSDSVSYTSLSFFPTFFFTSLLFLTHVHYDRLRECHTLRGRYLSHDVERGREIMFWTAWLGAGVIRNSGHLIYIYIDICTFDVN